MGSWKTFWSLNAEDRRAVLGAASVMAASHIGLRTAGYRRWSSLLSRLSAGEVSFSAPDPLFQTCDSVPARLAVLTGAAARKLPFQPTCLERSIGLWWLLRRRGYGAQIRIGGRKTGEQFQAHAWVEYQGIVLNDAGDEQESFAVFGEPGPVAARRLR